MAEYSTPLHPASPGERSPRVKQAQVRLSGQNAFKQDFHPGGIDGEYGPLTAAAVQQAKLLLGYPQTAADQTYGQQLDDFLSGKKKLPPPYATRRKKQMQSQGTASAQKNKAVDRALKDAQSQVVETPTNMTPFGAWYGMNGAPWCCIYVTYQLVKAGYPGFQRGTFASLCSNVSDAAKARQRGLAITTSPERGDLVIYNNGEHIEFFVEWMKQPNMSFQAVGGNTSAHDGSRSNGGEVATNERFVKDPHFPVSYFIRVGA